MEPRIQYAKTSDGVNIAYWTLGEGPSLVQTPPIPFSQVQLAAQMPEDREWGRFATSNRRLVRYDARGTGLSDREVDDFSLDAQLLDLEAVVDHIGLERFVLWGLVTSGPVAIAYAVRHPDRVSHLILWSSWARSSDVLRLPQAKGLLALADTDWQLFTETSAHAFVGWSSGDLAHRAAEFMRESITPETAKAIVEALAGFDVTGLLPAVAAPTLVFHSREAPLPDLAATRAMVTGIRGARLVLLEGSPAGWQIPAEAVIAMDQFLGGPPRAATLHPEKDLPSGTAVVLFADIAGSTALTERLGDAAFRTKARELSGSLRALIRECGGTPVEGPTLGDGVLAVFTSAREGIAAALRCAAAGESAGLPLHLGLHAGDVTREKDPDGRDNIYGGAVNIAARISALSAPGEVLVSETVRSLARTSAGVRFEDRGEQSLKGVGEAVRVWRIRADDL